MESFFTRYRNALVLIVVLLAQVIGLAVQVRRPSPSGADKGGVRLVRLWAIDLVTPPERLLRDTGSGIRGIWTNYIDLIHVREKDRQLKAQLAQLRLEEDSLAEDARQGLRLQQLLGFQEKYIYRTVAAQVIGTSGTEQSEVLLIDKGSDDGLKPDMAVITPDGIVGKTRDVFGHTSQVLEISDSTSGAGVILEQTRIRGVLRGDSWGQPEIVNVSPDERIRRGETVVTSGGDGIFPRGLAVGTVDRVVSQPDGTLVDVLIRPAANLAQLEEVLVITSTGTAMPTQMQQDLSEAEQTAAEVRAERLPSRADPDAPQQSPSGATPNSAPSPTGIVPPPPQPPPALHPDRYTPADMPPAVTLVPGQPIPNPNRETAITPATGAEPVAREAGPARTAEGRSAAPAGKASESGRGTGGDHPPTASDGTRAPAHQIPPAGKPKQRPDSGGTADAGPQGNA